MDRILESESQQRGADSLYRFQNDSSTDLLLDGASTTHFSVIDKEGNMVAATLSLNYWFGSGVYLPELGIFLNNHLDDFSWNLRPDGFGLAGTQLNAPAPQSA